MKQSGLYNKYNVMKTNGEAIDTQARYFVLRLDTDPAARAAVALYARIIEFSNPELSTDLRRLYESLEEPQP